MNWRRRLRQHPNGSPGGGPRAVGSILVADAPSARSRLAMVRPLVRAPQLCQPRTAPSACGPGSNGLRVRGPRLRGCEATTAPQTCTQQKNDLQTHVVYVGAVFPFPAAHICPPLSPPPSLQLCPLSCAPSPSGSPFRAWWLGNPPNRPRSQAVHGACHTTRRDPPSSSFSSPLFLLPLFSILTVNKRIPLEHTTEVISFRLVQI